MLVVRNPDVPIFSDETCTARYENVQVVEVEPTSINHILIEPLELQVGDRIVQASGTGGWAIGPVYRRAERGCRLLWTEARIGRAERVRSFGCSH